VPGHVTRRATRALHAAVVVLVALAAAQPVSARQDPPRGVADGPGAAVPGSELIVFHATFGPGDAVWEKFGHNAIWIHDATTGTTTSYNYGMFDFDQPRFVPRLMKGDMLYSMGVRDADDDVTVYSYYNRSVWLQRLNLAPAQRLELREFLEWNWLPQNRNYLYDYFRDNCSTRVRDALDRALGGAIRASLAGVATGTTYRWHSLRLTADNVQTYTGLLLGLGSPTDRPIDAWEEGFIPMQLMEHLRAVVVTDEAGRTVPLVAEERTLFLAAREPPPGSAPDRTAWYLLAGLLAAAVLTGLGQAARTRPRAALALALALSVWGVISGFFGVILALLWTATNHVASYDNLNLLQVNPLGFLLAVAAPLAVVRRIATGRRRHATARLAWPTAVALLGLSAAGLLLNVVPAVQQANGPIIALVLPIHAAVVLSLYRTIPQGTSPAEDTTIRQSMGVAA
jgi:nitrate reductase gamma subunit